MQFITEIKDDVKLLKALYDASEPVKEYMEKTNFAELLTEKADLTGEESKDEIKKIGAKKAKENMEKAVLSAFGKFPEETIELARKLIILGENEKPPHGMELVKYILAMLTDDTLLNFFLKSGALALK